jgi:predicted RNA-binding protein with RPS1 domain
MSNYQVGEIVTGIVTGLQPYGAFVTLDDGTVGLIHISEISDRFVRNVEDYLRLGDRVAVRLLAFEADTSHAKLSLKRPPSFLELFVEKFQLLGANENKQSRSMSNSFLPYPNELWMCLSLIIIRRKSHC